LITDFWHKNQFVL